MPTSNENDKHFQTMYIEITSGVVLQKYIFVFLNEIESWSISSYGISRCPLLLPLSLFQNFGIEAGKIHER